MPYLTTPLRHPVFNDFLTFLAHTDRAHFLICAHRAAIMGHTRCLTALGALEHNVGDLDRHGLFNNATLPGLTLRSNMFLDDVKALNNDFVGLRYRPRNSS